MLSGEKSASTVGVNSIINVVQHDQSNRKMELKSVVHLGHESSKKHNSNGVKCHEPKSSKTSKSAHDKPILLLPFGHQVSGRASMLCYDETTILKPYVSRELYFYQSIPEELKKLTPQFRGLVTVSFIEDSTTASILAYALPRTLVKPTSKSIIKLFAEEPKPHSKRCVKDFGKTHVIFPSSLEECDMSFDEDVDQDLFIESCGDFAPFVSQVQTKDMEDKDDDVVSELSQGFDVTVTISDTKTSENENINKNFASTGLHNPWNSKVLDDAWLKLKFTDTDNPANGKKKRFTLLENVVARYRRPCVLDLKIGTRVRENASPEKIARHVTAINLGARLSGMQIYHPEQERFTYHNKYYGHNLTVSGFKSNLRHFFSRGRIPIKGPAQAEKKGVIDKQLVEQAIKKLSRLKDAVESMKSHRFYSSSVLLLYEGDVEFEENEKKEDPVDEVMDSTFENIPGEEISFDTEAQGKEVDATPGEEAERSFSFSEFLHRIKQTHSKHHTAKRHHDMTSSKCHDDTRKASQKHMKGSVIYKHEKNQKRALEKRDDVTKLSHHHRDQLVFSDNRRSGFPNKSWPPRSKSAGKRSSPKVRSNDKVRARLESTPMELSLPDEESRTLPTCLESSDHQHCTDPDSNNFRHHSDVIDVRMIDFAHYCFHDKSMHPGPDGGFLFGLESLIKLLNEMLKL